MPLELGGKSAAIILEDADLDSTLPMLVFSGLMNWARPVSARPASSRRARATTRSSRKVRAAVAAMPVGRPDDPAIVIGPLISEKQRERVEGYISKASRKARGWSPAAAAPRAWTAAGSCSRRCSPTWTTR